jgi:GH15 family glucan-1,4-alpha-glucosidase
MNGRAGDARRLFERLLSLSNDVWLFSEEYDVEHERLIGNFPQAFTHLTLVQAAKTLGSPPGDIAARYAQSQPTPKPSVSA